MALLWILAAAASLTVACVAGLLLARVLVEASGERDADGWRARVRVGWPATRLEGYAALDARGGWIGVRGCGRRLWRRRVRPSDPKRLVPLFRRAKGDGDLWDAATGLARHRRGFLRLVRRLGFPHLTLEGTFGFEDPALTGWVAGCLRAVTEPVQALVPSARVCLSPEFRGPAMDVRGSIGFRFRILWLLGPCLGILWGSLIHKQGDRE